MRWFNLKDFKGSTIGIIFIINCYYPIKCLSIWYLMCTRSHILSICFLLPVWITVTPIIWNMAQSWMTRELAELAVDLHTVDINSGYTTHSQSRNNYQIPDATRENNLPSTQATYTAHNDEAVTSLKLHSSPKYSSELITLSNASQNSARMQCYFYCLWNHFIDYLDNPVLDVAVIYEGNSPFQHTKQEGMYKEFLGNPMGNVFLATKKDHEFLLSHKADMSNIWAIHSSLHIKYVENSINLMQITSPVARDPLHPTFNN